MQKNDTESLHYTICKNLCKMNQRPKFKSLDNKPLEEDIDVSLNGFFSIDTVNISNESKETKVKWT